HTRREEKAQRTTSPPLARAEGSASDEAHAARGESAADDEPAIDTATVAPWVCSTARTSWSPAS
ncbi:MAG: hypothetical protein M3517_03905, partial [Actinomycetota bacterium]|nr:hypothetical protein [Actinomycetota bacterium]